MNIYPIGVFMISKDKQTIIDFFSIIPDPRIDRTKHHKLMDILVVSICAIICGANNFVAIENFGKVREDWFKTFLDLKGGIPSHDTISRVFSLIDPKVLQQCFIQWLQARHWAGRRKTPSAEGNP